MCRGFPITKHSPRRKTIPKENSNTGLADILDDLLSGRKTAEQVRDELKEASIYLRAGNNYRELKLNGFARINGVSANVYVAGEKIDGNGNKVEPTRRAPKATTAKRK